MNDDKNGRYEAPLPQEGDEEDVLIFAIMGEVRREDETDFLPFQALLRSPDDDTAVRLCLEALAQEGYAEANLDQIGNVLERPESDEFQPAYDAAVEGEIALIVYEGGSGLPNWQH